MLSYYLKWRKNTESKHPAVVKSKNRRMMLLSNCAVSNNKMSRFIKEHKPSGLLSMLGLKAPLN